MKALTLDHLIAAAYLVLAIWLLLTHSSAFVEIAVHGGISGAYFLKARTDRPKPPRQ